tara:strand:- start:295 stop:549 length:255 start_codon:yes stop_codon:yes gene_type:complete
MASLKQVEKSLGRKPKELQDAPVLRHELNYLWSLFVSLKNAAEGAISYTEIQAYISIYGDLSVFEIDLIRTLDELHSLEVNKIG